MIRNPANFLSRCRKSFPDKLKSPKHSDEAPRSFASKLLRNRSKSSKESATSSFPTAKIFWKRIGLTTEKPIPIEDLENALATIRSLKTALSNLISLLKLLINDADIALCTTPRPTCSDNCKERCIGGSKCYREAIETFDKVIVAGGPMCFVETEHPGRKRFPTSYSHLNAPSKTNTCPSSRDHDHLHVTNSHRVLLENIESQLTQLRAVCSQLSSFHWTYRNMPIRLDWKRQRSQCLAVVENLNYWNDISRVQKDYEWVWGGSICRRVDSWRDFATACKDIAEMDNAGIGEFNLKILIKNDLLHVSGTKKKARRTWSVEGKKMQASTLYPDNRRPSCTPPQPEPETEYLWEEKCEQCDKNIEETRNARGREAGGNPKTSKFPKAPDNSRVDYNENPEQFLYGVPQGLEQVFAKILKVVAKTEDLASGRFSTKAKGKWRSEKEISPEEELVLYNRHLMPSRVLCSWCKRSRDESDAGFEVI